MIWVVYMPGEFIEVEAESISVSEACLLFFRGGELFQVIAPGRWSAVERKS